MFDDAVLQFGHHIDAKMDERTKGNKRKHKLADLLDDKPASPTGAIDLNAVAGRRGMRVRGE